MRSSSASPHERFEDEKGDEQTMATFETVPLVELKTRLSAKLLPLVEEYRERLEKLGGRPGRQAGAREGGTTRRISGRRSRRRPRC
jgi:hypothetical protein